VRVLLISSGLAIIYVLTGWLGLKLAVPPGYATAIFLPAGVAVSAMLIAGAASLPGTFLGSLILNLWVGYAIAHQFDPAAAASAVVIALASMLQAVVGGSVLRRAIGEPIRLDNGRDLLRFLLLSPLICLTSGTLSLGGMWALGTIGPLDLPTSWMTWWIGDTLGVLVVLPLTLVLIGEPRRLWRRRAPYVALPMISFFALFVVIFIRLSSWENDQSLLEFRMRSQQLADSAQASLEEQSVFLEQLGSVFSIRGNALRRDDFSMLADKLLQRFSTIQAIEWAPRVEAGDRDRFEMTQAAELPGFKIRERAGTGTLRAAEPRAYFYPVTYLEPLADNEEAIGFDLASDPVRRAAVETAIATGKVTATAPLRLVQEHGQQAGLLLTYGTTGGQNGPGIILIVLRMGTFADYLLAPLRSMMTARFIDAVENYRLFDNLDASPAHQFFQTRFEFGNRRYALRTEPTPLYLAEHRGWQSWVILVAGALSTGLLGAVLLLGSGDADRARRLVEERTHELREANQRLSAEMAERERAQSALLQARRMEAMGQLTGGVAHDFNNLLTVILGNLELLRRHVTGAAGKRLLSGAEHGAERGAQLIRSLLAFARQQTLRPEIVEPNHLISEFSDLMRRALGESIQLRLMLSPSAGRCQIDPAQFQTSLLNLVVNARDAMPGGGVLTIETRTIGPADHETARSGILATATHIEIVVRDTGHGMAPEVMEHAFEPFYTTKDVGGGSGLGLSQVYGFVRQSGGQVEIASQRGAGTEVTISLPLSDSVVEREAADDTALTSEIGMGTETILVVEDDPDVRQLATDLLDGLGYSVLTAADGPEALSILRRGDRIDLLFSDIVVPKGMRGDELARHATALRTDLKVLLTSGYAAELPDGAAPDGAETAAIPLLRKPYRRDELARAIRAVLDGCFGAAAAPTSNSCTS
jgi:signal transduction histidine kinase/CheY-like chemotaxis protein